MTSDNPNGPYGRADGIQPASGATGHLRVFRQEKFIASGTAFLVKRKKHILIMTALHNLMGRNFLDGTCLDAPCSVPNKFELDVLVEAPGTGTYVKFTFRGQLFSERGSPLFYFDMSKNGGDIAVIRLDNEDTTPNIMTFDEANFVNWTILAGLTVKVLGYPSAIGVEGTPIWKTVHIASEPSKKVNGYNKVLLDGLTFEGMSGGPVVISQNSGFTDDAVYRIDTRQSDRIIGIYGGRYHPDGEKSGSIGFYWPYALALRIVDEERQVGEVLS